MFNTAELVASTAMLADPLVTKPPWGRWLIAGSAATVRAKKLKENMSANIE